MEAWQVAVATEPWANPDFSDEVVQLKLAPGTASGYKGVHKAGKKWEARLWIAGRGTRVVWRDDSAKVCAWTLAMLELYVRDPDAQEGPSEAGRGAGALARVPRQRSCADASVLVSQPQAARKRQKRAAAREMTWPTRTCVTVEQFMRGPV